MATTTSIRWQQRVPRPYHSVHDALTLKASEIFHQATKNAESQASSVVSADLHTKIAGVEIHRDILINVESYTEIEGSSEQRMIIELQWEAADTPFLFPTMQAQLHVLPVGQQTQLDFRGQYAPPLGLLGKAIDAFMGAKIAETSVQHFVEDVSNYLIETIPAVSDAESKSV